MLTNSELLQELLSIQGRVEYDSALEDLIDTVEKAVADEETAAEPIPNPFDEVLSTAKSARVAEPITRFDSNWERTVPKVTPMTEANRWESAGNLNGLRSMPYRETL